MALRAKGDSVDDYKLVARDQSPDARGIFILNGEGKLCVSVLDWPIAYAIHDWALPWQAFVKGGSRVGNGICIDTLMRRMATIRFSFPMSAILNFASNFPSIAFEFIFLVLTCTGWPKNVSKTIKKSFFSAHVSVAFWVAHATLD